ncbi:MAG: hypothetical protein JWM41_131 [Gemmatimonadetes bacterium]|nr:hypothetical protein [Gemmatimonadota bacterium]
MKDLRKLIVLGAATTMLGACMHHKTYGESAGDVTVDSLSATRTALLRIDNSSPTAVRVYTVIDGKANYVAKAMPGQVRTWVLDPALFPASSISFEERPTDGSASRTFGPYKVNKNETVDVVIAADPMSSRAVVHRSTP